MISKLIQSFKLLYTIFLTLLRSFEIIENLIHNRYTLTCKSIITDLVKAKQGMLNLKYTYNDDTKFCCDMDVLIEQVSTKLTDIKEHHPVLFEHKSDTVQQDAQSQQPPPIHNNLT